MICPFCRRPLEASPAGWERIEMQNYAFGAGTVQPGVQYENRKPARAATIESDVAVPSAQSAISGVICGVIVGSGAALVGAGIESILWGAGACAIGAGLAWTILLRDHRASLWALEKITGADIDGDGYSGPPPAQKSPVRVEVVEKGGRYRRYVNTPLDDDEWTNVARAVLIGGASFSRRGLKDAINEEDYPGVYKPLLQGGLLRQNGKGVELTPAGRSFLRQYLSPTDNGGR